MTGEHTAGTPEKPKISRDDAIEAMESVVGEMSVLLESHSEQLEAEKKAGIQEALGNLKERTVIIGRGIHQDARPTRLYDFIEWFAKYPDIIEEFIDNPDRETLDVAEMIDRIGPAIQNKMQEQKLLKEDSITELRQFDQQRGREKRTKQ